MGDDRDSFEFRRRSQKVFVQQGDVILRLHKTDIVRVTAKGDVVLSTGGWATPKTMKSMNDALELFGMWVDTASGRTQGGRWQVTDSDGTVHPYTNNSEHYTITIRSKGPDDRQRAQWLAEAYEVPYTPPAAAAPATAAGTRVASAAPAASAQPAATTTAARSSGAASSAAAAAAWPPSSGGSWANVAKPSNAASTGAATRMTGPGGVASGGRTTGPGAAAAPSAAHRTTGPPGFTPGSTSSSGYPAAGRPAHQAAAAGSGPAAASLAAPAPADPHRVLKQIAAMGIGHEADEADMCVVCMEEPRSTVLVPCGHMVLCKDCCEHIIETKQGTCPVCNQHVEYSVEVNS